MKDERKAQEVFDLADYERSEELRKAKSRSKKNHSRFTLLRSRQPGNTVSPEASQGPHADTPGTDSNACGGGGTLH